MIALLQRVTQAQVSVGETVVGAVDAGVLAFIGVERPDSGGDAQRLAQRILHYRLFEDAHGRMNLSVLESGGGVLLVPQFTLAADTGKGNRASFARAAPPEQAQALFARLAQAVRQGCPCVQEGRFGAHMRVQLVNDGPVTFWLSSRRAGPRQG